MRSLLVNVVALLAISHCTWAAPTTIQVPVTAAEPVATTGPVMQFLQQLASAAPVDVLNGLDLSNLAANLNIGGKQDSLVGLGLVSRAELDGLAKNAQEAVASAAKSAQEAVASAAKNAQNTIDGVIPDTFQLGGAPDSFVGLGVISQAQVNELFQGIGSLLTTPFPSRVFRQSEGPAASLGAQFDAFLAGLQSTVQGYVNDNSQTISGVCNAWDQVRPRFPNMGIYQAVSGSEDPVAWGGVLDFACNAFSPEYAEAQKAKTTAGLLTPFIVQAQDGASNATAVVSKALQDAQAQATQTLETITGSRPNLGRFLVPGRAAAPREELP